MSINISLKKNIASKQIQNHVLFCDDNFNIQNLKKFLSKNEFQYISDLIKSSDTKKDILFLKLIQKKPFF